MTLNKIVQQIKHVAIETNNRCNLSHVHKKCPASKVDTTVVLPMESVHNIIHTLGRFKYAGAISFYHYNDSLIEPRLFSFISYAKNKCKHAKIFVGTNGLMLTTVLAKELYGVGVDCILVSTYTNKENVRINKVRDRMLELKLFSGKSFSIRHREELDDRLVMQGVLCAETKSISKCRSPISEVIVRSSGNMPLCCYDISCSVNYGNVNKKRFGKILIESFEKMKKIRDGLTSGKRELSICKSCIYKNRWNADHMKAWFNKGAL